MQYTIQETAKLFGITTNKIRFYEKKGLITPSRGTDNDYRYFSHEDILRLQTILLYRAIGLEVSAIKNLLEDSSKTNYLDHLYIQWRLVNDEMHSLSRIRTSLEQMMDTIYETNEEDYESQILGQIEQNMKDGMLKNHWKDRWNFNNWAKNYDKDVIRDGSHVSMYAHYDELLSGVAQTAMSFLSSTDKVLDIGVGTGNLSNKLYHEGYQVIGLDQSRAMLEVAKSKNPNLKVRLGEFMKLPFDNGVFKVIVSTYAFHHLDTKEKELAIDEMLRVLTPDGRIILGDLMFESSLAKSKLYETLTPEQIDEIEDEYYTDIAHLESYVQKHHKTLHKVQVDMFCWQVTIQ